MQPAPGDLIAQRVVAVLLEPLNRHPLQRRPAVGFIPLLAGFVLGRQNSTWGQQPRFDRIRQTFCLLVRRHSNIQRHNAGGRKQRQLFASPVVIAVDTVFIIPEVTVYRIATGTGFLAEQRFCLFLAFQRRDVGDGALQGLADRQGRSLRGELQNGDGFGRLLAADEVDHAASLARRHADVTSDCFSFHVLFLILSDGPSCRPSRDP